MATLFAAISKRLNLTPNEKPSGKSELYGYTHEKEKIVEVHEEHKEQELKDEHSLSHAHKHEQKQEGLNRERSR